MAPLTPREAMALAIAEGKKGAGFVSPNPLVGCVILDSHNNFLAAGYHARLGRDHAEVDALKKIADQKRLAGAHVFVTLEPCAHQGRTPSCAATLAQLPIASVTYGLEDPNPLVSGRGVEILRTAGKRVEVFPELREELEDLAEIFLVNMRKRRPFVAVKVATSLDGRMAISDGSSKWITGETARAHGHFLRGCYDAVLTGSGTILRDDPRLDARADVFAGRPNRLVILDPEGDVLTKGPDFQAARVRSKDEVIFVVKPGLSDGRVDARRLECPLENGEFDLRTLVTLLAEEDIHSLFIEAGGATISTFLKARLVDRLYLFLAPKVLGRGLTWTEGLSVPAIDQALVTGPMTAQHFGQDIMISARLQN